MQLSDVERERIRLEEQYRAEVRGTLGGKTEAWSDKLGVPLFMLVVTALISGLLVPWILGKVDENRRALELQSRLIEQIVADDAKAQVALSKQVGDAARHRINLLENDLERRVLALLPLDADERKGRREELAMALSQERSRHAERIDANTTALRTYLIEHQGNVEWVKLHYGEKEPLTNYARVSLNEYVQMLRSSVAYQDEVTGLWQDANARLRTCAEEAACRKIVEDVRAEMNKRGDRVLGSAKWNEARSRLITFISATKPRI